MPPTEEILLLARLFIGGGGIDPRLRVWTELRMKEYIKAVEIHCGGLWDKKDMAEWIGDDLNIDEEQAYQLCEDAGFPEGFVG